MSKTNLDHIVIRTISDQEHLLECRNCNGAVTVKLPMPLNQWLALAKSFERDHKKCHL